ncbi:MAG: tetratricopeptide repeat protein, partial [Gemmatimonadetes bacterium]|nr:tetratricopeptide repeat protein [Gemmatimonadota bacterium]
MIGAVKAVRAVGAVAAMMAGVAVPAGAQDRSDAGHRAFRAGRYEEAIRLLGAAADRGDEGAARLLGRVLAMVGRYADAEQRLRAHLAANPDARTLWLPLGDVLRDRGELARAEQAYGRAGVPRGPDSLAAALRLAELKEQRGEGSAARRDYRRFMATYNAAVRLSSEELAAVARAVRHLGREDPQLFKDALRAYDEAVRADSGNLDARVEQGDLFLDKYNGAEARATYQAVLTINPNHPAALLGLARAAHFEGNPEAAAHARQSLEVNPRYVPALVFAAQLALEREAYDAARERVARALDVNPASLEALSLLAATSLLQGDSSGFQETVTRITGIHPRYASLYTTLADLTGRTLRYHWALAFARQAVARDSTSWRGYSLMGVNQLRLGDIAAARKSLETAFAGDPYDVWTKNTLDLLDHLDRFPGTSTARFRVLAAPAEADLLALYAGPLAEEAYDSLVAHYRFRPATPVRVELYDRHADFSVRTVGLVGLGALGVSFGPVVAMDSPSAREPGQFHWGSVLWHEIAHTFHLGLTDSRVPRWFTEGLAVFEERRSRPGWGDDVTPGFLTAFLQKRLVPVGELNRGFTNPDYPEQLGYSYYQASLVCDLIAAEHGLEALRALLQQYRQGRSTAQAFQAVLDSELDGFDRRFDEYVHRRFATPLAALRSSPGDDTRTHPGLEELVRRARREPGDFRAQFLAGEAAFAANQPDVAEPFLLRAKALFPEYAGTDSPSWYLAQIYRQRGARPQAVAELEALTAINAGHYPALLALAA